MTSQVAIFNPLGVAIASDTVATLTYGSAVKTVDRAEKIWALPAPHAVAVLVSGSAMVNSVHTRLILGQWTRALEQPLPRLRDYSEHFTNWLSSQELLLPEETEKPLLEFLVYDHYRFIHEYVEKDIEHHDGPGDPSEYLKQRADEGLTYLEGLAPFVGPGEDNGEKILMDRGVDVDEIIDYVFHGVPGLDKARQVLVDSAALMVSRDQEMQTDSIFSFVGYGEGDYHAAAAQVGVRGRYGGALRCRQVSSPDAPRVRNWGNITVFAQYSAILGFVSGGSAPVLDHMVRSAWSLFEEKTKGVEGLCSPGEFARELLKSVNDFSMEYMTEPMNEVVKSLALEDAAALATSLVGIQALRAKASPTPAGVGGFIESLVIDRSHGVRWISRLPK